MLYVIFQISRLIFSRSAAVEEGHLRCGCWRKPIVQVSTKAWYAALERAGIDNFVGTISGTPGQAGTCRTARRCPRCRNWAVGPPPRWCGGVRTSRRSTWRRMRNASWRYVPLQPKLTAQNGTGLKMERARIAASPWNFGCGGPQPDLDAHTDQI